ncbi:hypothetical protein [Candidatus Venteria ishoeyi]|uniref:Uncharacterized protein n=1 Tax=Candidatus Venteria ishoeyi TaxID=1899563 RepID=A0A1H6F6I1_9GAMM|nr:hypothetical protein [Candidatus Venteria ishoeyi]SEH04604.1 Uncharacterised protein [Candidatus Venteria ishoeyi]
MGWKRKSLHESVRDLENNIEHFKKAYLELYKLPNAEREQVFKEVFGQSSIRGTELQQVPNAKLQCNTLIFHLYPNLLPELPNEELKEVLKKVLSDSSIKGVELLRMLALTIRSEQDNHQLREIETTIGAVKTGVQAENIKPFMDSYRPPYSALAEFNPLPFREGLNKIAHADGRATHFAVDEDNHDLILSGTRGVVCWLAILSLPELCRAIKILPDAQMPENVMQ